MSIVLGAIADDFTGATDLANKLVHAGMRCIQIIGAPETFLTFSRMEGGVDAVVVALDTRTCPAFQAVEKSLAALDWLRRQDARQIFFKYRSTFDSTREGNIGPVADALLERLEAEQTVMAPAVPSNGRTVYQGHLFIGDRLLNDSGMQYHPLTPMVDANLVRVLSHQTPHPVGLLSHATLAKGAGAARERLARLRSAGIRHVICDALDEDDCIVLAKTVVDHALVTGSSKLGQMLPGEYRQRGWLLPVENAGQLVPASGACLVLSGSCCQATLGQIKYFLASHDGFAIDPLALAESDTHIEQALSFARRHLFGVNVENRPVLVYTSASPDRVRAAQHALGGDAARTLIERALARLACTLVEEGVGRLVVAGGETSAAVVTALGVRELRIGQQIDPGVPWMQTRINGRDDVLSLMLKLGNDGGVDFFTRAFGALP